MYPGFPGAFSTQALSPPLFSRLCLFWGTLIPLDAKHLKAISQPCPPSSAPDIRTAGLRDGAWKPCLRHPELGVILPNVPLLSSQSCAGMSPVILLLKAEVGESAVTLLPLHSPLPSHQLLSLSPLSFSRLLFLHLHCYPVRSPRLPPGCSRSLLTDSLPAPWCPPTPQCIPIGLPFVKSHCAAPLLHSPHPRAPQNS